MTQKHLLTSMTRARFIELANDIASNEAWKRWPEGKIAKTKAEKVEDKQIRALTMITESVPDDKFKLLFSRSWTDLFIYDDGENITMTVEDRSIYKR